MNDFELMQMQDYSDWQHSRYMRWVHDGRGTVETEGVINESEKPQAD